MHWLHPELLSNLIPIKLRSVMFGHVLTLLISLVNGIGYAFSLLSIDNMMIRIVKLRPK